MSKDRLLGMASALIVSAIGAGFVWVQDIGTRLALVEDDLTETVDVMMVLHPRSPSASLPPGSFFLADGKQQQHQERKRALNQLRQQTVKQPPGDDDDSASGTPPLPPEPRKES